MKNILFLFVLFTSCTFAQVQDYNLRIGSGKDPDSTYCLLTATTGSNFAGRGQFKSLPQLATLLQPFLSGGGGTWGSITGTLSNQTDLQNALNAKLSSEVDGSTTNEIQGIDNVLSQNEALTASRSIKVFNNPYYYDFKITDGSNNFFLCAPLTGLFQLGDMDNSFNGGNYMSVGALSYFYNPSLDLKFGINNLTPTEALDVTGNGLFSGTLTASNLSGTNTGDQDLSGYALNYSSVTYAAAATLVSGNDLVPSRFYKITDRGDRGIILQAVTDSTFNPIGTRLMLCPKTYSEETLDGNNWLGIWNSGLSPSAGDKAIWGGKVWTNNAGAVGSATNEYALSSAWTVAPKSSFSDNEYIEMVFGISYDFANDWIERQWDGYGNEFGYSFFEGDDGINPVDISDWNYGTRVDGYGFFENFYNNKCLGIYNNFSTDIYDNNIEGDGNSEIRRIYHNTNQNYIRGNNIDRGGIFLNSNTGNIEYNFGKGSIHDNTNDGDIYFNNYGGGEIRYNSNTDGIGENVSTAGITDNENTGGIHNNFADGISSNTNGGEIQFNYCIGGIDSNSSGADISNNNCELIINNSNTGDISYNILAKTISSNTGSFAITGLKGVKNITGMSHEMTNGSYTTNASTLTLNIEGLYVATGTTATFSLPTVSSTQRGVNYSIKNRGSGNLTINVVGGGSTIYTTTTVSSVTMAAGDGDTFICDGTYWNLQ